VSKNKEEEERIINEIKSINNWIPPKGCCSSSCPTSSSNLVPLSFNHQVNSFLIFTIMRCMDIDMVSDEINFSTFSKINSS